MYSRQVTAYNADRHAGHVNLKPTTTGSFRVAAEHMESSGTQHTELRTHIKNKIENYTILIPKGNSYCRRKRSARGPQFKVYQQKLTYYNGHPSKYKPRPMLLNPSVLC